MTSSFFSTPNLSWEAMLITTKVELGVLTDIDMILFCERAIRGGINGTGALRHFKANNQYMQDFDPSQPSVFGAFIICWNNAATSSCRQLKTERRFDFRGYPTN